MHNFFSNFKITLYIVIILLFSYNLPVYSQAENSTNETTSNNITSDPDNNNGITHKDVLRYTILGGALPVTLLYGAKAWRWGDGDNHDFKSEKEGWFGQDTSLGGADKAGHFYAHYLVQRALYSIFDYTENGAPRKWVYSLGTTVAVGTLIEVGDGWSSRYGFSYEDLIIDIGGLLFGALLDYSPTLDAFLGLSIEYYPTDGYKERRQDFPLDFVNDYSGFKYLLNIKLAGFEYLGFNAPDFLRYVMFDVGYYTRGYSSEYDVDRSDFDNPTRNWFVGISINLAEVVSDLFEDKKGLPARIARKPFEYYHVPVGYTHDETL